MRMLRWISGNTPRNIIRKEFISKKFKVARIEIKMIMNRLRWLGHMH